MFRDALKGLEDHGDVHRILRSLESGAKYQKAVYRVLCLINSGQIEQKVVEGKLLGAAIALIEKILSHQDAINGSESPYEEDVICHTNVPVESFFGKYDNLDNRFMNMAKTTICQAAVASFNRTDLFVHQLETLEVERILASRRQSRQNERAEELFQRNERHRARSARHEKVNFIFK